VNICDFIWNIFLGVQNRRFNLGASTASDGAQICSVLLMESSGTSSWTVHSFRLRNVDPCPRALEIKNNLINVFSKN
jgi:hypothetical protein